jgi:hypothetical protein
MINWLKGLKRRNIKARSVWIFWWRHLWSYLKGPTLRAIYLDGLNNRRLQTTTLAHSPSLAHDNVDKRVPQHPHGRLRLRRPRGPPGRGDLLGHCKDLLKADDARLVGRVLTQPRVPRISILQGEYGNISWSKPFVSMECVFNVMERDYVLLGYTVSER